MFEPIHSLERLDEVIATEPFALIYVSLPTCSVCHALLPQLESALKETALKAYRIDAHELPQIASRLEIMTVPAVLFFAHGKEYIREARFVQVTKLKEQINMLMEVA